MVVLFCISLDYISANFNGENIRNGFISENTADIYQNKSNDGWFQGKIYIINVSIYTFI